MSENTGAAAPAVTVVVPTCNRTDMLPTALRSIARQTFTDFECLVVNDHVATRQVVDKVLDTLADLRFRVLHNPQPSGAAVTRNQGIRQARGRIVAFLDDDDCWMPDYLKAHVQAHRAEVGLVYSGVLLRWQDQVLPEKIHQAAPPPPLSEVPTRMLRGEFEIFTTSSISIKKHVLDTMGEFDERLPSFEDWELCYRIGEHFAFARVEQPLTVFFQHLRGRMTQDLSQRREGLAMLRRKFEDTGLFQYLYEKYTAQIYFTSIRNNVLVGKASWNPPLFKCYLQSESKPWSSRYQLKVTVKMLILLVLRKRGLRMINQF